jgi:protein O-GlcNAc transferase
MLQKLLERLMRRAAKLSGNLTESASGPTGAPVDPAIASADRLIAEGNEYERKGDPQEACARYRRAILAAPRYAKAQLNLGIGLQAAGDADGAARAYERALALDPADPYAAYNFGKLLYLSGRLHDAEPHLRSALQHKPDFGEARVVLSGLLEVKGDLAGALAQLEAALSHSPAYAGALYNYAVMLRKAGRTADAEAPLRRLLIVEPGNALGRYQLGSILLARGKPEEAEDLLKAAAAVHEDFPDVHIALYDLYRAQGRFDLALEHVEQALRLRPGWALAWFYRGVLLNRMHHTAEGETALRRAIELDPALSEAYRLLAGALLGQMRLRDALDTYRAGRAHDPEGYIRASELLALNFSDEISSEDLFARHQAFGAEIEAAVAPLVARFANRPDPDRRLRIGYVSGDFHYHPVSMFLIPLLERHDRSAHEIYCYSISDASDAVTRQIVERSDVWRSVHSMPRVDIARSIHDDAVDVLVDLAGHSSIPSFNIFARRPAPVQAAWLGYLCTTGLKRIGYRISDAYSDPPGGSDRLHTETVVRLPRVQWCYRPFASVEPAPAPPCIGNGFVTFGSFNYAAKLSRPVRRLWAQILQRVPRSRLLALGIPEGPARETVLRDLAEDGVEADRVSFEPRMSLENYLARIGGVDIALDSMPYSGGTTTCDCLWMGVPVVTLPGSRSVSRSAGSILSAVGLTDWIAAGPEDYVRRAADAAADPRALTELRGTLRARMRASALMDETGFARDMEAAYRGMWRAWCAAQS